MIVQRHNLVRGVGSPGMTPKGTDFLDTFTDTVSVHAPRIASEKGTELPQTLAGFHGAKHLWVNIADFDGFGS